MTNDSSIMRRMLAVDARSLAACRIGVCVVLLIDLIIRIGEIEPFLSDSGMLPLETWQALRGQQWVWTLYSLSDAYSWTLLLFTTQAVFAVLLLTGCWTRAATIASWVLLVSLHVRNPLITNSGDALLRMMLFWGMFCDWGGRWSLDARRRATSPAAPVAARSIWPACLMMCQVSLVYIITGWVKLNDIWLSGEALERVTALDFAIRPWGRLLSDYPSLLTAASIATPWIELSAALLVWSPWATARLRTLVVAAFIVFHLAIDLTLHVGMFSLATQAAWLVFLPAEFWDRVAPRTKAVASERRSETKAPLARILRPMTYALCAIAALAVVASNWEDFRNTGPFHEENTSNPSRSEEPIAGLQVVDPGANHTGIRWLLYRLADLGMLHQEWTMFARPPEHDSWIVARATTATGDTIDILRDGAAAQSNGSPTTAHELPSQHWRYYFRRLTFPEYQHFAPRTAEYLLHRWNRRHDDKPIIGVKLVIYVERFGEVGFESQTLAQAGDSSLPMQLGDDTFDLDRALRALDAASGPNNTGR